MTLTDRSIVLKSIGYIVYSFKPKENPIDTMPILNLKSRIHSFDNHLVKILEFF